MKDIDYYFVLPYMIEDAFKAWLSTSIEMATEIPIAKTMNISSDNK